MKRHLQIGNIRLDNPYILAPMAGFSDLPFRLLCRKFGAAMAVSEMLTSNPNLWQSKKTQERLAQMRQEPSPRCVQILGNNPEQMAKAAQFYVELGADIIDINLGCSVNKVVKKNCGSILMKDEQLCTKIFKSIVAAINVPVTVKIRSGWSPDNYNALNIAQIAQEQGISALTIHGRFGCEKFSKPAEYLSAKQIKDNITIPVIVNGNIDSHEKAKQVMEYTNADGIMIGRAALGQPWIFAKLSGKNIIIDKEQIINEHLDNMKNFYGEQKAARLAIKHMEYYNANAPFHDLAPGNWDLL